MKSSRKVFVNGLRVDAQIGVYDHEFGKTQPLIIDFEISVVEPEQPGSDNIEDVLCYNKFSQGITDIVAQSHIQLVETLAERICAMALDHSMVLDIRVRIYKPDALDMADAAGVELFKSRI